MITYDYWWWLLILDNLDSDIVMTPITSCSKRQIRVSTLKKERDAKKYDTPCRNVCTNI